MASTARCFVPPSWSGSPLSQTSIGPRIRISNQARLQTTIVGYPRSRSEQQCRAQRIEDSAVKPYPVTVSAQPRVLATIAAAATREGMENTHLAASRMIFAVLQHTP